jgi:hypothetical protein
MDEIRRYTAAARLWQRRLRRQVETLTQRTTIIRPRGKPSNDSEVER